MSQNLSLTAGELIVFSEGEYSDYGYCGQFVVLCDVAAEEVIALADKISRDDKAAEETHGWSEVDTHAEFLAALIRLGALASINMREIHIGSYGRLEVSK